MIMSEDYYDEESSEEIEDPLDNDELSAEEDGFLRGYEEESESDEEFGIDSELDEDDE
jgi:hypothetical protein